MKKSTTLLSALLFAVISINAQNKSTSNNEIINNSSTLTASSDEGAGSGSGGSSANTKLSQTEIAPCAAMNSIEFSSTLTALESKNFSDSKMELAKQIANSNCFSTDQVYQLMKLFASEDQKVELAKYCYMKTTDQKNYYQLNDGFAYKGSIDELSAYIKAKN
jgi:hypothetical protein